MHIITYVGTCMPTHLNNTNTHLNNTECYFVLSPLHFSLNRYWWSFGLQLTSIKCFLCTRSCPKCFTSVACLNLTELRDVGSIIGPLLIYETLHSEMLSNLPEVTQLVSGRAGGQTQAFCLQTAFTLSLHSLSIVADSSTFLLKSYNHAPWGCVLSPVWRPLVVPSSVSCKQCCVWHLCMFHLAGLRSLYA